MTFALVALVDAQNDFGLRVAGGIADSRSHIKGAR